jgi:hypothetical protein
MSSSQELFPAPWSLWMGSSRHWPNYSSRETEETYEISLQIQGPSKYEECIDKCTYTSFGLKIVYHSLLQWLFHPIQGSSLFRNHFFTHSKIPWTSDQPVARPLPKHRTTQTQNKRINTPNIHALSGMRTHDPSVRASEDSLCLRPRGHCDRLASELAKTVHALDRAATVTVIVYHYNKLKIRIK